MAFASSHYYWNVTQLRFVPNLANSGLECMARQVSYAWRDWSGMHGVTGLEYVARLVSNERRDWSRVPWRDWSRVYGKTSLESIWREESNGLK